VEFEVAAVSKAHWSLFPILILSVSSMMSAACTLPSITCMASLIALAAVR
jgi:hypothetical protein